MPDRPPPRRLSGFFLPLRCPKIGPQSSFEVDRQGVGQNGRWRTAGEVMRGRLRGDRTRTDKTCGFRRLAEKTRSGPQLAREAFLLWLDSRKTRFHPKLEPQFQIGPSSESRGGAKRGCSCICGRISPQREPGYKSASASPKIAPKILSYRTHASTIPIIPKF